jgi:hypothetical protein
MKKTIFFLLSCLFMVTAATAQMGLTGGFAGVSPSTVQYLPFSTNQIKDSSSNLWTVSGGEVYENAGLAGYSANVIELTYYNNVIYQENGSGNWYSWTGTTWTGPVANPTPGIGAAVSSVTSPSSGTITSGSVTFTVTFNLPVVVGGGTPTLNLNTAISSAASYTSGSGTKQLIFTATPTSGETANPVATTSAALSLNGAIIQTNGNNAVLTGANSETFTGLIFAPTSSGSFTVSGGQIIGPNNQPFVPLGVDVVDCGSGNGGTSCLTSLTAADITAAFPGISIVKVQMYDNYPAPSNYTAWVNSLTSQGIVVQFTDYNGYNYPLVNSCYWVAMTGSALTTEVNWYSAMATAFIGNPYVWFNTQNEICDGTNPPTGNSNAEQVAVYDAIRATGSNAIIGIELLAGFSTGTSYYGYLNASSFSSRTNVIWDVHYYNESVGGGATTVAANQSALAAEISSAQTFATSANGTMPAFIGEYGNSTDGTNIDTYWSETVQAIFNEAALGFGSGGDDYYFPYSQGGGGATGDQMFNGQPSASINPPTIGNSSLDAYGLQVAAGLSTTVSSDYSYYFSGSYGALLTPWNTTGANTWTESYNVNATMPNNTKFTWNYTGACANNVCGYDFLSYGNYNNTGGYSGADGTTWTAITPAQIENIVTLTASHNLTLGAEPTTHDVIYDMALTSVAVPTGTTFGGSETHEIVVYAHSPSYMQSFVNGLPKCGSGSVVVSGITWTCGVNGSEILFMQSSGADVLNISNLNILTLLQFLVTQGTIANTEYFNGLGLGAEMTTGGSTLTVNSFSVNYTP